MKDRVIAGLLGIILTTFVIWLAVSQPKPKPAPVTVQVDPDNFFVGDMSCRYVTVANMPCIACSENQGVALTCNWRTWSGKYQ